MDVAQDIRHQLQADFPLEQFQARLDQLVAATSNERVQRCIVWAARGHPWYFDYLCRLTKVDFRDIILAAEYDRLNAQLYDFRKPIGSARIDDPYR
jgi:hypothetical protein